MSKKVVDIIKENNKEINADVKNKKIIVSNCWGDKNIRFVFSSNRDCSFLKNIIFPKELFALYHKDKELYEFVYAPVQKEIKRSFEYYFQQLPFKAYYGTPSNEFIKLASRFDFSQDADVNDRTYGMIRYASFYKEDAMDNGPVPINFFVKGGFNSIKYNNHLELLKHINFFMSYYDRRSPTILFFDKEEPLSDIVIPCKSDNEDFPKEIYSKKYDSTLIELFETARETNSIRLRYIFYFQILEYCSYYYVENTLKRKIANIIKSPDILNSEKYSNRIIEIYSDYFKNNKDDKRMDCLLTDLCTFDDIKDEIKVNSKYFIADLQFDGGLTIKGLFNRVEDIDNPPKEIISTIRRNIEKIRNVIVHARESRENTVITPTQHNSSLLRPYLYLLRRIAEVVMIKYE